MSLIGEPGRRRVFVPQALGADEFLRVTWHEGRELVVFSHWDGDRCVAATPVRADALGELLELAVAAYVGRDASDPDVFELHGPPPWPAPSWPAPSPTTRVDPPAA